MQVINPWYDIYLKAVAADLCPVFVPTDEGWFAAVIAPKPHQLDLIRLKPSKWLYHSCRAVRELAVESGYMVKE